MSNLTEIIEQHFDVFIALSGQCDAEGRYIKAMEEMGCPISTARFDALNEQVIQAYLKYKGLKEYLDYQLSPEEEFLLSQSMFVLDRQESGNYKMSVELFDVFMMLNIKLRPEGLV
jgi:hypothetical protein